MSVDFPANPKYSRKKYLIEVFESFIFLLSLHPVFMGY